jgi:predicted membrane chloride channel (bestrophin family)
MNNSALSSVFNYRIVFILIETVVIYFLYDFFQINLKIDFTIMSIAIVFPLVFSITSAYQRRQEAINIFAEFRNKIIDLTNIFYAVEKIEKEDYNKLYGNLMEAQEILIDYLKKPFTTEEFNAFRRKRKEILILIDNYKIYFNEREKDSLIRVKNELFLTAEKIRGIKIHGTPISLRKYCLIFIYLSPLLYNSQLIVTRTTIGVNLETIISLLFSLVVSFVLMALYNVQDYIENPFDQEGLDDLKIDEMEVKQWESLNEV